MKYVLITRDGPEHRYVANRLDAALGLGAVVLDAGRPRTRGERVRQVWKRYALAQLCGRLSLRCLKAFWRDAASAEAQLEAVLGPGCKAFARPEILHHVQGVNTAEGLACVRALGAERILVYGTGIIGSKLLALSPRAPLNMHTGISPDYRGASCAFWPLHEGELHKLGATIHEVSARVDGGNIYSVRQAELQPDDELHAIFGRCVVVGADQFVEVLQKLESEEFLGEPQAPGAGREFRAAMRGLFAELRVRRAIRRGLVRDWCAARGPGAQ